MRCASTFSFRRNRVSDDPTRPAEQTAQATESEARSASEASGRGGGANAAESAGAAGSAPSRGDPEAVAHAPDQREGGHREGGAVRFAVGADCCGALGCRETDGLLAVEQDGDRRVLCPDHARRWSA